MRICIIAEGCYPFVVGGVSSWVHSLMKSFPEHEFVVLAIAANRKTRGQYKYELPENVVEVHEVYLDDVDWVSSRKVKAYLRLNRVQHEALYSLLCGEDVNWDVLFDLFQNEKISINRILMGMDFLECAKEVYRNNFPTIVFSDYLWTMRSIYMPLFLLLQTKMPKADLYHCVATGYAGVLGALGMHTHRGSRLLISEHGIYTREREEELIKAKWVQGVYKSIWIDQFKKMSQLAYKKANRVTALYAHARQLQLELGCDAAKTMITPNGVDVKRFENLAGPTEEDKSFINIGAVLRVAPIKDVKTMIRAFSFAKKSCPNLKLWIMGPTDEDEEYAQECFEMVDNLQVPDVVFTGRINVTDYLGRMDMTILTSISEGQPLTILEGYAAKKPAIATDVGNCRGLIYGEGDDELGSAGILCHIMNVEEISGAMIYMANHTQERLEMGEIGYKRLMNKYKLEDMHNAYTEIYKEMERSSNMESRG